MPTFRHPCPYCGTFIDGAAVTCPACGVTEPFTHGRCPSCRAQLQAGWVACPKCGRALTVAETLGEAGSARANGGPVAPPLPLTPPSSSASPPATAASGRCTGCGAPLPAGARFCQECGTLVA